MTHNTDKPTGIFSVIISRMAAYFRQDALHAEPIPSTDDVLARRPRSVFLRHLDCGSCNGCELELNALGNPVYDSERFGIKFEASPSHADALVMTGVFTRNLTEAALLTLAAMPEQKVVTVGDCAADGGIFRNTYALAPRPEALQKAIIGHVPGCPPAPVDILRALGEIEW